jgi:hypothetical protein
MSLQRSLSFAAACTVVATFAQGAHAQAVKLQATAPAAPPPPTATVAVTAPAAPAPAVAAAPAAPAAGGYRLPVSYTERGITNPAGILSPEADFIVTNYAPFGGLGGSIATVSLALGAGYSITDDFGVRATVIPLEFNSPFAYLGPSIGATYRLLKGDFELGVAADINLQTCGDAGCYNPQIGGGTGIGIVFAPSVPMRVHLLDKKAVLDFQPAIPIGTVGDGAFVGLNVPVRFAYDIIEPVHVGAMTGFGFDFKAPNGLTVGDTFAIPFGVFGGYALAGKEGPMLDIDPFVLWPNLFTPAAQTGLSKADGSFVEVGVNLTYYLYL